MLTVQQGLILQYILRNYVGCLHLTYIYVADFVAYEGVLSLTSCVVPALCKKWALPQAYAVLATYLFSYLVCVLLFLI